MKHLYVNTIDKYAHIHTNTYYIQGRKGWSRITDYLYNEIQTSTAL